VIEREEIQELMAGFREPSERPTELFEQDASSRVAADAAEALAAEPPTDER
jgi:hypothetical protein